MKFKIVVFVLLNLVMSTFLLAKTSNTYVKQTNENIGKKEKPSRIETKVYNDEKKEINKSTEKMSSNREVAFAEQKNIKNISRAYSNFAPNETKFKSIETKSGGFTDGKVILWPVNTERITSNYGNRIHPIKKRTINHAGLDIGAPKGMDIQSATGGVVTFAGVRGAYGNLIEIKRNDGLQVRYAHLSVINVSEGQSISEGDIIGKVGATGKVTGPHLHFELLYNSESFDPLQFDYH